MRPRTKVEIPGPVGTEFVLSKKKPPEKSPSAKNNAVKNDLEKPENQTVPQNNPISVQCSRMLPDGNPFFSIDSCAIKVGAGICVVPASCKSVSL
jgi:hypothetical protein